MKLLTKTVEFIGYITRRLSLGSAEQYSISRQGVYDIVKRAEDLEKYEEKLGLVKFQTEI